MGIVRKNVVQNPDSSAPVADEYFSAMQYPDKGLPRRSPASILHISLGVDEKCVGSPNCVPKFFLYHPIHSTVLRRVPSQPFKKVSDIKCFSHLPKMVDLNE